MLSINYYLGDPFKAGIGKDDVKAMRKAGKSIAKMLNENPTPIYLILTFPGRKLVKVNVHEKIRPIYWNFDERLAKPIMHGSLELNDRLQYLKAEVVRQYRKMITATPRVTLPQIKALVTKILDDGLPDFDNKSLIECLVEFTEERRSILSPLTTKKYNTLITSLTEWMEWSDVNQNQFTCDSVDADFELSYKRYLIEDRRLTNNSISKYLECIKKFMRWARKKGYHNSSVFEDFSIKRNRSEVIWINEIELSQLVSYNSDDDDLMRVKHVFLFMIYTAQRYLDYKNLRRRDVVVNPDNSFDWVLYQRKATKTVRVTIPLIKDAVDILEKFGFSSKQLNDCLIPIGENAIFNKLIKDLCERAGLDSPLTIVKVVGNERVELHYKKFQKISCHTSRKSWVSLSLQRGLNPEYLTAVTGHQSLKTLREHYVGLDHESKRKAVNKIWETNAKNQKRMPKISKGSDLPLSAAFS